MLVPLVLSWVFCILPIIVLGRPEKSTHTALASIELTQEDGRESREPVSIAEAFHLGTTGQSKSINYTLPWPATKYIPPTVTSQGLVVTSVIPIYETCNLPGAKTTSCSPSFQTFINTECSTVLTGYFTRHTVSKCNELVTFSTQYNYFLATAEPVTSRVSAHSKEYKCTSTKTSIHNVTKYYAAPWQSIASNTPSDIRVKICGSFSDGTQNCTTISEVWVIHTEYVPIYHTEAISVSTVVSSTGVLAFGPAIYITITPGTLVLSTQIVSTFLFSKNVTSISTITSSLTAKFVDLVSITKDPTTTIYITGPESTKTIHVALASPSTPLQAPTSTRTTTITSTTSIMRFTTLTLSITVQPTT